MNVCKGPGFVNFYTASSIVSARDQQEVIFFDQSKPSHVVDDDLLLLKVSKYEVCCYLFVRLQSFLSGRKYFVRHNDAS